MSETPWRFRPGGLEVRVRVTPRGGRDGIEGVETLADGRPVLELRVRAVPEDGAANDAVRRLLAQALGLSASEVALTAGDTARVKTLTLSGDGEGLARALTALLRAHA
jgi:hypothetical protein